jgi:hypothetical protein
MCLDVALANNFGKTNIMISAIVVVVTRQTR